MYVCITVMFIFPKTFPKLQAADQDRSGVHNYPLFLAVEHHPSCYVVGGHLHRFCPSPGCELWKSRHYGS